MDGVSAAASVVALTQITAQVFELCRKYYTEVREARKEIQSLRDEMTSLQDVLTEVAELAEDASNPTKMSILDCLNRPDGPVQQCQSQLTGLVARLDPGNGPNRMRHFGLRALKWPFSHKDVGDVITAIERHEVIFNLALTANLT